MEFYKTQDLEQLTGIKAHTIRIWEKRYQLLQPKRTDTNIRLYTDEQLHKLLNVATLIRRGYKISELATLSSKKLAEMVNELALSSGSERITSTAMDIIDSLIHATIDYNEAKFEDIFAAANENLGVEQTMHQLIYPYLQRLGLLWNTEQIATVQEHFATHIVRRKLQAAIDHLPLASKKDKKFILFLPPDEWHDIPLLYAYYIIRKAGWQTVYLGQSVPLQQLSHVISQTKPSHILSFITSYRPSDNIISVFAQLKKSFPSLTQLLSGSPEYLCDLALPDGIYYLTSPSALSIYI